MGSERGAGQWKLSLTGCEAGTLKGIITPKRLVAGCPEIILAQGRRRLAAAETRLRDSAEPDLDLSVEIPGNSLSQGVHVLTLEFAATGEVLAHYPVAVGQSFEGEVHEAIARLDAELAALRRAFFRAMADPPIGSAERPLIVAEAIAALTDHLASDPTAGAHRSRHAWMPPCPLPQRSRRKLPRRKLPMLRLRKRG